MVGWHGLAYLNRLGGLQIKKINKELVRIDPELARIAPNRSFCDRFALVWARSNRFFFLLDTVDVSGGF